ncbi:MAG: sulfatase [Synoicihabitans sp.]
MKFHPIFRRIWALVVLALAFGSAAMATPPNIVLILTDDLGINDLGCYGNQFYESPHIDSLSRDGMRFDQHYSSGAVCSPTRTALITGKFPARTHSTEVYDWGVNNQYFAEPLWCPPDQFLNPDQVFLPEVLRAAGYRTGMFGKWHISGVTPEESGYDEWLLNNCDTQPGEDANNDEFHLRAITQKSNAFMAASVVDEKPFFVVVSHHSVHVPQAATTASREYFEKKGALPQWADRSPLETPIYAGMIKDLDDRVGDLLAEIERLGIEDNTLVIFTSDNGGLHDRNAPYRAGKGSWYEGGIRVPFIARWPERVPAGSASYEVIATTDYFLTLANLSGSHVPSGAAPDSMDFGPALDGGVIRERKPLIFHFPHYRGEDGSAWLRPWSAIRKHDHVFVFHWEVELLDRSGPGRINSHELYDLAADPAQTRNLVGQKPMLAARLKTELLDQLNAMEAQIPVSMEDRRTHIVAPSGG